MNKLLKSCLTGFIVCNGCTDFIHIAPPKTELVRESVFVNEQTAWTAVTGLYIGMAGSSHGIGASADGIKFAPSLSADEYGFMRNKEEFLENRIDPESASNRMMWQTAYATIYEANAVIEGVRNNKALAPEARDRMEGEARFARAFNYFYLTNLYGDVPLVLNTDYHANALLGRSAAAAIYGQIVEDLEWAKERLPDDYSVGDGQRIRANHWVCRALLARVYAYLGEWNLVETEASAIIGHEELFKLEDDLGRVFFSDSREAIWQLHPFAGTRYNAAERYVTNYNANISEYASLSDRLVQSFEAGDQRAERWVATRAGYHYSSKYRTSVDAAPYTEYSTPLRLAEQYLLRAEACKHLGKTQEGFDDLNRLRFRSGLDPLAMDSDDTLMRAIEQERKVELFVEFGHRWLDLKRWGKADEVLKDYKPHWTAEAVWYPIPESELLKNPNLTPNGH